MVAAMIHILVPVIRYVPSASGTARVRGGHHLGLEGARGDRVDGDALRAEFLGQDPGEVVQSGLAGLVGAGREGTDVETVDGADVDHACRVVMGAGRAQQRPRAAVPLSLSVPRP
ncbi:hypothetical protein GCM10010207_51290 [Streptomyces atratus]|nr:hypothetical protein GCM10010207_51290 [Streptomyces atratus]